MTEKAYLKQEHSTILDFSGQVVAVDDHILPPRNSDLYQYCDYLKVIVVGKGNFLYCEALEFAGGKVSLEKEGKVFEGKTSNGEELPDGMQCVRFRAKSCYLAFRNAEDNEGFYDIDMRDTSKPEAKKVFKLAHQHRKYWLNQKDAGSGTTGRETNLGNSAMDNMDRIVQNT